MHVATVHYHTRRGGVTRIISSALESTKGTIQHIVLSGDEVSHPMISPSVVASIQGLDYQENFGAGQAKKLADTLEATARQNLGKTPDVWHIHNHTLGKNVNANQAFRMLVERGCRVLFHVHDFPEDGRPKNYKLLREGSEYAETSLGDWIYPQADHVHYAVLNYRDFSFLKACGICEARLHLLPNPVAIELDYTESRPPENKHKLILYLTRAIRRKNVGELLFWAALEENKDTCYGTSLIPENQKELAFLKRWKSFSSKHNLPVAFNVGQAFTSFSNMLQESASIITTSIAEGFGLSFLEPWLYDKELLGREIPEITGNFSKTGVDLSSLYESLDVPTAWMDFPSFKKRAANNLKEAYDAYGRSYTDEFLNRFLATAGKEDRVDFGRLDETAQEEIITHILKHPSTKSEEVFSLPTPSKQCVASNKQAIQRSYSLAAYGEKLRQIYTTIADSSPSAIQPLDTDALLDCFLKPERFFMLLT